uniref:PH domain-containing protein n=1 Tax=Arcella intermedia TaxID=1963864 RepID=A0A6B2L346_9EUKA
MRKSRKNEVFWKKVNDEEAVGDEFSKKRGKKSQNFDDTWKKIRNMTNSCEEKNKEEKIAEKVEENWDTEEMDFFTFLRLEEEDLKKVPTPELPPLREKDPAVKKREKKKEKAKKEEDLQYTMDFEPDKVPLFELAEETKQALQNLWKDFLSKKTNTAFGEESAMTTFYQIFSELFLNTDAGKRLFKGSIAKLGPSLVKYLISIMGALDHPSSSPLGSSPKETIEPKPPRDPKEPTKAIPPEESYVDVLATTRRRKETLPKVVSCETFRDIAIQHRIYGAVNEDYLDFGQAFCETMERMEIDFFYKEEAEGKSVWMYIFEVFGNFIMDFGKKIEEKKTSGHVHIAWRRDGNWKKCFLVLSLDTLYIYNKEEKSKLLLHIKLSNILNIDKLNKFDHNYVPSDHGFELNLSYHRKPTIWICTTENFAKNWMKELKWRMVALDGLEA